ncbi:MAG: hypothetical protein ACYCOR_10885 [Acidobacteriaceae bacterium]
MSNVVRMPTKFHEQAVPVIGKNAEEKRMEAFMNQLIPRKEVLLIAQQISHQTVSAALEWVADRIPEVRTILDEEKAKQEAKNPPVATISDPDAEGASDENGGGDADGNE